MTLRTACRLSLLLAVHACVRPQPAAPTQGGPVDQPAVATIVRDASPSDSALSARHLGRLDVVVRPAERPTQPLPEAQVLLVTTRDTVSRVTDDHGLASFEALDVGDHEIVVRRIGYGQARAIVTIKPGCRTDVEAYIAMMVLGIAPPPPMRGRVIVTTC